MSQSNLLVIMSDEHQSRAMGCAGHPFVQTPNLDKLAARGMRFTDAYTPSPICVPARASFATGQPVHKTRLWDNAMPYDGKIPGWGHSLQAGGVPVESIGKLHYRHAEDPVGFDAEQIPMMVAGGVGMVWASIRKEEERVAPKQRMLGEYIGPGESNYTDYDKAVTAQTTQWFADRAASDDARPWCLYVGLVAPHFPLVVPQEFYDLYPVDDLPDVKLHPRDGFPRHPWVEKQNAMMNSEDRFEDEDERRRAMAAYYGLCSWLDFNIGQVLTALNSAGFGDNTTVIYTSDHGDNLGARGLWGKSNLYQESVSVPLIVAGPSTPEGTCDTPVSLLDVSASIPSHFGLDFTCAGTPLPEIAESPDDLDRVILSEYHAAGSVSGGFMLRKGQWKLIHYIDFQPELFDLQSDPQETTNLADDPDHRKTLAALYDALETILDPASTDAQAFADQAELIKRLGGREAVLNLGAPGATPPPKT